jgi:hypothetical protein
MINTYAKVMGGILLLIGILGFVPAFAPVGLSNNWDLARKVTLLFAAIYGIITLMGFLSSDNIVMGMRMNLADDVLHLGITASALLFGLQQRYPMYR